MDAPNIRRDLHKLADPKRAKLLIGYFKIEKDEYGRGCTLGIRVPEQRRVAKKYFQDTTFPEIQTLLKSEIHEERFVALEMLVMKYENMDHGVHTKEQKTVVEFYLKNTKYINNWDLVDTSAPYILGDYLLDKKDRSVLYRLVKSKNMWERRIAMVSTNALIQKGQFDDTINIANVLLNDEHDLIHKAVGWMLREVGKKDQKVLVKFLDKHISQMPRTALRYAIEKFPEKQRKRFLSR